MQPGWIDSPHHELALGDFRLESGESIRDFRLSAVASQLALVDHLGIGRLQAVVGASMGGMQALQWAVSHGGRPGCP